MTQYQLQRIFNGVIHLNVILNCEGIKVLKAIAALPVLKQCLCISLKRILSKTTYSVRIAG